jgi:ubiquinol-cytochrome c reductase cytochrome c subunit
VRRLLNPRNLLPAAVLVAVGLGTALGMTSGAGAATYSASRTTQSAPYTGKHATYTAGATHLYNTRPTAPATATSCQSAAAKIGYVSPPNSGSPHNSTATLLQCTGTTVVAYGTKAITYKLPGAATSNYITAGKALFQKDCASCHLPTAGGSAAAPDLRGVGPATVDFWVTTGRMPAATPAQIQADQKPPVLGQKTADEIAAWINSLTPSAPYVPTVHVKSANLTRGASLFALDCAACHTITGAGDALAFGTYAPSLHQADNRQVAEAIRTGPGNMPRFTGNLTDAQVRDIVAYVTEKIQHPSNTGGFGLGGVGPVTEGFVALLFGVGGLMLVCFWIGDRA